MIQGRVYIVRQECLLSNLDDVNAEGWVLKMNSVPLVQGAGGFRTMIQNMGFICARELCAPYETLENSHAYKSEDTSLRGNMWGKVD